MRKIKKLEKPAILIANANKWTKEYCSCLSSGQTPSKEIATRYKDPTIKAKLEQETHGKCAYCESKIKHITYGDIEHILPKNKDARPDLYVEWTNLTLACEQCNRSGKRTYYEPKLLLINPYVDDPEEHFQDLGPLIMSVLCDVRAFVTENVLKLNRSSLVERRIERITQVKWLLSSWAKEKNSTMKEVLEQQLHEEYSEEAEYSSTVKAFLKANKFPVEEK